MGSSSHIHQSLWTPEGESAFFDEKAELSMSETMRHYVAGLVKYAPESTYFLAPYINSYKRFAKGTFAPTKVIWSVDNRTAGFRLCGAGTKAVRIECRIGGSDINPYLAIAAQLAAGIRGLEDKLDLPPPTEGDVYKNKKFFDFGISNENEGKIINKGLLKWKESFGARAIVHDFYEVKTSNYYLLENIII